MHALLQAYYQERGEQVIQLSFETWGHTYLLRSFAPFRADLSPTLALHLAQEEMARFATFLRKGREGQLGIQGGVGDGRDGYPPQAPYGRIIATGSCLPVPAAWVEYLKEAGRLIMDLRGPVGGGIIVADKQSDGWVRGQFLAVRAGISFMRLRAAAEEAVSPPVPADAERFPLQEVVHLTKDDPAYACAEHFSRYEQFRGADEAVNDWLQWIFPALALTWKRKGRAPMEASASQTVASSRQQEGAVEIVVRGRRPLWSEMLRAYQDWLHTGKPRRESATLLVDPQGRQCIQIQHAGHCRTFPLFPLSPLSPAAAETNERRMVSS